MSKGRGLTKATFVVKLPDGAYLTQCRACKRLRNASAPDFPSLRFGTRPEANAYLREHEKTETHVKMVGRRAPRDKTAEEKMLEQIFGEKFADPPCRKCGRPHNTWMDCNGSVGAR